MRNPRHDVPFDRGMLGYRKLAVAVVMMALRDAGVLLPPAPKKAPPDGTAAPPRLPYFSPRPQRLAGVADRRQALAWLLDDPAVGWWCAVADNFSYVHVQRLLTQLGARDHLAALERREALLRRRLARAMEPRLVTWKRSEAPPEGDTYDPCL